MAKTDFKSQELYARRIREERLRLRLTRKQVVEMISAQFHLPRPMHEQTLVRLESCARRISDEWLMRLAKVYGVPEIALRREAKPGDSSIGNLDLESLSESGIAVIPIRNSPAARSMLMFGAGRFEAVQVREAKSELRATYCICDLDQCEPSAGNVYVICFDGEYYCRRYRQNPERWEPLSGNVSDIIFPTGPIDVLGAALELVTRFVPDNGH